MPTQRIEISVPLRHAIITCRLLYRSTYDEIERKTGVKSHTASLIINRAIEKAGNDDFNDVLLCAESMQRTGRSQRVEDGTALSSKIRNAMLKHSHLKPHITVLDQENIVVSGKKRPSRSLLERVQHEHHHVDSDGHKYDELVRGRMAKKPRLGKDNEQDRRDFCVWCLEKLAEGAIFICSDEKFHEVGAESRRKNCTRLKAVPAENYSAP